MCTVYLCGRGGNYFNQLHLLALRQYLSCSASYLPGSALQGRKGETSLLAAPANCEAFVYIPYLKEMILPWLLIFPGTKITYKGDKHVTT